MSNDKKIVTMKDQHTPAPPALDEPVTTKDQHTPAPPALDLDRK
ncbi:hypothetical protein [Streptomyces sp. IBSBF 2390]